MLPCHPQLVGDGFESRPLRKSPGFNRGFFMIDYDDVKLFRMIVAPMYCVHIFRAYKECHAWHLRDNTI